MYNQSEPLLFECHNQTILNKTHPFEEVDVRFSTHSLSELIPCVITFSIFFLLSTYFSTSLQCRQAISNSRSGKEPPIAPYCIPYLGHTLSLLWNMNRLFSSVSHCFRKGLPVNVRVLFKDVYIVSGAENIATILKNEAYAFPSDVAPITALKNIFALPKPALKIYQGDTSGIKRQPAPWSDVKPHRRIRHLTFKATASTLSGAGLEEMNQRFAFNLAEMIAKARYTSEWTELPDLCKFVRAPIFQAAVDSMFGPHLLSLSPSFAHDFWEIDQRLQQLSKGYPSWMTPKASRARQKCLDAMKKWHTFANEHHDDTKADDRSGYEPLLGASYTRAMMHHFSAMEEMTPDAKASNSLGMMFAMIGNTMPAISWSLLEIFQAPTLLARVRTEVASTILPSSPSPSNTSPTFNLPSLFKNPLLQSIYAEILRLHVVIFHIRSIRHSDFHLGDWLLHEGSKVLISSRPAHMDSNAFNTGTPSDPHPIDEFWAERFLIPSANATTGEQAMKFSLDGLNGSWIPYGGGQRICPGRHFAKAEILLSIAFFVSVFDVELMVPKGWKAEEDGGRFGLGTLVVKGDLPVRVRRMGALGW